MKEGLTSVIILCYNNDYSLFHYTGNCIGSVREHTKLPYEIIVVDNGSGIKHDKPENYKANKVFLNKENKGVAAGWNQGIRAAEGEYLCFLNNDTMVFDNWLEGLQEALGELDLVAATPMYGDAFARAPEAAEKASLWKDKPISESFSDFRDFSCVLTRKSLFDEIGLFDEQFFAYCEDLDFYRRMEKAGKKFMSTKKVNIHHIIGATTLSNPNTPAIMNKSKELLHRKWGY
jgi:GT2 family glycosyltransferase